MPRFHIPFTRHRYRKRSHIRLTLTMIFVVFLVLLLGPLYIVYKPPHALIRYFQYRWPDVLWHVNTQKRLIALTIDDAPSQHTAEIMQTLRDYEAHATFFVIGSQAVTQDEMLTDMVRAGHELGNHAMHDEPSRSLSSDELLKQLEIVQGTLDRAYDTANATQTSKFFRPGSGFFSSSMRALAVEHGFQIALGDVYPHDPQIGYAGVNARHILSMVRAGSIVICHDRRSWTVPMLKTILPELKRRGYEVVTLSQLLARADG